MVYGHWGRVVEVLEVHELCMGVMDQTVHLDELDGQTRLEDCDDGPVVRPAAWRGLLDIARQVKSLLSYY